MVGRRGQCDADYPSKTIRQDIEYGYDGALFSIKYEDQGELFQGLSIWKSEKYRALQGTRPVISLTFANAKEGDYTSMVQRINQILTEAYYEYSFLLEADCLLLEEKEDLRSISKDMPEVTATMALHWLCKCLYKYYGKKVLILLDEYDTPMQEAYINGYWDRMVSFTRSLFHAAFKTNPYLDRAIMTGITRISRESIFSDLNNLEVVTPPIGRAAMGGMMCCWSLKWGMTE